MNTWQERFAKKMARVRDSANDRCEQFVQDILEPMIAEFSDFAGSQGLKSATPMCDSGVRTFRFGMGENMYVLISFRPDGLEECEMSAEFSVPRHERIKPMSIRTETMTADRKWAETFVETALDTFADAVSEAFDGAPVLVEA